MPTGGKKRREEKRREEKRRKEKRRQEERRSDGLGNRLGRESSGFYSGGREKGCLSGSLLQTPDRPQSGSSAWFFHTALFRDVFVCFLISHFPFLFGPAEHAGLRLPCGVLVHVVCLCRACSTPTGTESAQYPLRPVLCCVVLGLVCWLPLPSPAHQTSHQTSAWGNHAATSGTCRRRAKTENEKTGSSVTD